MGDVLIGFSLGILIGSNFGLIFAALLFIAKEDKNENHS